MAMDGIISCICCCIDNEISVCRLDLSVIELVGSGMYLFKDSKIGYYMRVKHSLDRNIPDALMIWIFDDDNDGLCRCSVWSFWCSCRSDDTIAVLGGKAIISHIYGRKCTTIEIK